MIALPLFAGADPSFAVAPVDVILETVGFAGFDGAVILAPVVCVPDTFAVPEIALMPVRDAENFDATVAPIFVDTVIVWS